MKTSARTQRGGVANGLLALVVVILIGLSVLLYLFGTIVPPGNMGVRQVKFGPGQGFSKVALKPGLHWSVPFYSTVHLVPKTLQLIHFNREPSRGYDPAVFASLEVQSADRATLDVDLSVLYRFYEAPEVGSDGKVIHGGPEDLFKLGTTPEQWINEVRRRTEDQLKRNLGLLHTAKFYAPVEREEMIAAAQDKANAALAAAGVKVEALLLRRFTYREERIDQAIFEKNLQEQEERFNNANATFTKAKGLVERAEAEGNATVNTIKVTADSKVKLRQSEGDLYETEKRAEADLLIAKAQAQADKLKADALAQTNGSKVFIGKEIAPLLSSLRGGVVTDVDPYDLDAWAKKLGVEGK